jgi:hypothetical protein
MSAVAALILLAEAASPCAPAARLAGGAMLVREDGVIAPVPFEHLGPAISVRARPNEIQQVDVTSGVDEAQPDQAADQCEAVIIPIA